MCDLFTKHASLCPAGSAQREARPGDLADALWGLAAAGQPLRRPWLSLLTQQLSQRTGLLSQPQLLRLLVLLAGRRAEGHRGGQLRQC